MPFILINKPKTWTSNDVTVYLRRATKTKKVGHAGTLDPFATGLLIVGIGRDSTKRLDEFKALPKTYIATIKLGAVSDTQDSTGTITQYESSNIKPDIGDIKQTLQSFLGKQTQIAPMYSAKKIQGQKLYNLAREGVELERKPHEVEIFSIDLLEYNYPYLKIEVKCGAGTYIRTLAQDIGEKLGVGAYCDELERTKIGDYSVANTIDPKTIDRSDYTKLLFDL